MGRAHGMHEGELPSLPSRHQWCESGVQSELIVELAGRVFALARRRHGGLFARCIVGILSVGYDGTESVHAAPQEHAHQRLSGAAPGGSEGHARREQGCGRKTGGE